jgi:hypothetical protein
VKMGEDRARSNKGAQATRDHAWFIGFAPFDAPEIAIACIVEHAGGGGGAIAAPIVQQMLQHYFSRDQGPSPEVPAVKVEGPAPRAPARVEGPAPRAPARVEGPAPAAPVEETHALRPPTAHAL